MTDLDLRKLFAAKRSGDKPIVLIIDDNAGERKLYRLLEEELGMSSYIVSSCEEGLEAVNVLKFDLILMDIEMPGMNGLDCTQLIQGMEDLHGSRTPIIAVTANAMPGDRQKCLDAGMDDYVSKPFSIDELKRKIDVWAA